MHPLLPGPVSSTAPFAFGFTGSSSSSSSRERSGTSIPSSPSSVTSNPSYTSRELDDSRLLPNTCSAYPLRSPPSPTPSPPWSPTGSLTASGSSSLPYGSPGVQIPPTPYQILPTPKPSESRQDRAFSSVEADGCLMIRRAVPPALLQDVVGMIYKGLPVMARQETEQMYETPIQALRVRDEFVLVCLFIFLPATRINHLTD